MNEAQKIDILMKAIEALLELKSQPEFRDHPLAVEVFGEGECSDELEQVSAYIPPFLKRLAEERAKHCGLTMSKYIATLIRKDLEKKEA